MWVVVVDVEGNGRDVGVGDRGWAVGRDGRMVVGVERAVGVAGGSGRGVEGNDRGVVVVGARQAAHSRPSWPPTMPPTVMPHSLPPPPTPSPLRLTFLFSIVFSFLLLYSSYPSFLLRLLSF